MFFSRYFHLFFRAKNPWWNDFTLRFIQSRHTNWPRNSSY